MSRAFVKDEDETLDELPQLSVSPNPNFVTERGLRLIDDTVEALRREQAQAQHSADKATLARVSRDLRYWVQRRTSAQEVKPPKEVKTVAFATRVTIRRDDGRTQHFGIVGEDEADPGKGLIGYSSPVARALLGKPVGAFAEMPGGEAEILALETIGPEG